MTITKPVRRIRAQHKITGESVTLHYTTLTEAMRRNKGLTDFEFVGAR